MTDAEFDESTGASAGSAGEHLTGDDSTSTPGTAGTPSTAFTSSDASDSDDGSDGEYFEDPQVTQMLATLGSEHTPMPAAVWAAVQVSIAAESAARTAGANTAPVADGAQVISLADRVRRRTKMNLIGSVALAAAAAGVWLVGGNHAGGGSTVADNQGAATSQVRTFATPDSQAALSEAPSQLAASPGDTPTSSSDSMPAAAEHSDMLPKIATVMTFSGKSYNLKSLTDDATSIDASAPKVGVNDVPTLFAGEAQCVDAEISRMSYEDPNTEVSADLGFLNGQPVAVLVEKRKLDAKATPRIFVVRNDGYCSVQAQSELGEPASPSSSEESTEPDGR